MARVERLSRALVARAVKGCSSMNTRKKLIEVALPLEAINLASAREKSIRHEWLIINP